MRHLRTHGAMRGVIASGEAAEDTKLLIWEAQRWSGMDGLDLAKEVSCTAKYTWEESTDPDWYIGSTGQHEPRGHIVAYDFGIKHSQLRLMTERGFQVTVVPATATAHEVLSMHPDGVFLSNGPGDPAAVTYAIDAIREMLGKVPIFGICLGHQLLGLALGGQTHKLLFGHRGGNQPVRDPENGAVSITVHNHGFAITDGSLPDDVTITRFNLNDECVEGLRCQSRQAFSVQYHPEASPGSHDALNLFDEFVTLVENNVHSPR